MRLPREYEDELSKKEFDLTYEEDVEHASHRREVRRKLEDRLEKKRLREELDDLDDEFDWKDYDI